MSQNQLKLKAIEQPVDGVRGACHCPAVLVSVTFVCCSPARVTFRGGSRPGRPHAGASLRGHGRPIVLPGSSRQSPRPWVRTPSPQPRPTGRTKRCPWGSQPSASHSSRLSTPPRSLAQRPSVPSTCRVGPLLYATPHFSRCHFASSHFPPCPGTVCFP